MDPLSIIGFALFGLAVGAYGTLIGAGGGFLIVPALVLVLGWDHTTAAATSLFAVMCNAASGTVAYWRQRPRASQIGAWTSPQSAVVSGRAELERLQQHIEGQFGTGSTAGAADPTHQIPLPPHWGGWRIEPVTVEFWQGRTGRMHDRLRYRLISDHAIDDRWVVERLAHIRTGNAEAVETVALTKREREVLERLARGANNDAVAAELGIATQTVRNYISVVYGKLGVNSRAEAIVWARERGVTGGRSER